MRHSWGATARAHVQGSFPDLKNYWTDCVQIWNIRWWGPVSRVACKSQLGPNLHVCTWSVSLPDLKNCWIDCAHIWYTDTPVHTPIHRTLLNQLISISIGRNSVQAKTIRLFWPHESMLQPLLSALWSWLASLFGGEARMIFFYGKNYL